MKKLGKKSLEIKDLELGGAIYLLRTDSTEIFYIKNIVGIKIGQNKEDISEYIQFKEEIGIFSVNYYQIEYMSSNKEDIKEYLRSKINDQ